MFGSTPNYLPLPQSNSESDFSEEELHTSNQGQSLNTNTNQRRRARAAVVLNNQNPDVIKGKQCSDDSQMEFSLRDFHIANDDIPACTANTNMEPMSTRRKICFILSICLCVFTVIFFLWILPCEIDSCSQPTAILMRKTLSHIELYGPISIVPGGKGNNIKSMTFLFRKSLFKEWNGKTTGGSGVVSFLAGNKDPSWWVSLEKEPSDLDCNVIDVNLDGENDCLVVGQNNLFMSIDGLSGQKLWNFNGSQTHTLKSCNFDFPLVLPDLNGDGVGELLSICSVDGETGDMDPYSQKYFVVISGGTGGSIGRPAEIANCLSIFNVTLENENVISYSCLNWSGLASVNKLPLQDFLLNIKGSPLEQLGPNKTFSDMIQHQGNWNGNSLFLDGRRFSLENRGICPGKCSMFVKIEDERNETYKEIVWARNYNNSYGMAPVGLVHEKFTGFVFKFWEWETKGKEEVDLKEKLNSENNDEEKKKVPPLNMLEESKTLEYALLQGDMPKSVRLKRTVKKRSSERSEKIEQRNLTKEKLTFHRVLEKILLISFNETNMQVINTSQCEVVQICGAGGNCQPDAHFQRQSLHIADVDEDNFQELITYSSSFINHINGDSSLENGLWQLQSEVEVIKLERELAKVYGHIN